MYIPKAFEIKDKNEIHSFLESNAFGQLVSNVENRPFSTHIPFLLSDDKSKLIGHLAKQNPQHQELENQEVLAVFQGAHDYISPSWYRSPGVPTWDYQAAHFYGRCSVFTDHDKLQAVVDILSNKYESSYEPPWLPEYRDVMLNAIVGFEIEISEIQCKYKLSQNRTAEDIEQVIKQLEANGSHQLAREIRRNT
jgi:transcriptional regulator